MQKNQTRRPWALLLSLSVVACSPGPKQLLAAARQSIARHDLRGAENDLDRLLERTPNHAAARQLLGEVLYNEGDLPGAEHNLRLARDSGAPAVAIQLPLLQALLAEAKYGDVLEEIESGPERTGKDRILVLRFAAKAHAALGAKMDAEADYRAALEIDPASPEVRTELATLLAQSDRAQEAMQLVVATLADQPDFVPALLMRASFELQDGRAAAAERLYAHALDLERDAHGSDRYRFALAGLAEAQLDERKVAAAAANADALLALDGDDPAAGTLKAKVELAQDADPSAEARLEQVVSSHPKYWPAHALLGAVKLKRARLSQAEQHLLLAVQNLPQDVNARLWLAQVYVRQGKTDAAKALFAGTGGDRVSDGTLLAMIGRAAKGVGDDSLSARYFEQSEQTQPRTMQELLDRSRVYLASGELDRALRTLQDSSFAGAENKLTTDYLLTLVQIRQRDFKAAAATAQRLAASRPKLAWPLDLLGSIALLSADVPAARRDFDKALRLDPKYLPSLLNAGRAALLQHDGPKAEGYLRRALDVNPKEPLALIGLAQIAAGRGDFAAAQPWLERAPDSAEKFALEGDIDAAQQRFAEAADSYARSYALAPSGVVAQRLYVAGKRAGREHPEAELASWSRENPADLDAALSMGSIALEHGDFDLAASKFEAVVASDPKQATALNDLAWIYSERDDHRALDMALRAHDAQPDNPNIDDTLGWIFVKQGDAAKGLPLLTHAAQAMPKDLDVQYHFAAALDETGNDERAQEILERLVKAPQAFLSRQDAQSRLAALRVAQ